MTTEAGVMTTHPPQKSFWTSVSLQAISFSDQLKKARRESLERALQNIPGAAPDLSGSTPLDALEAVLDKDFDRDLKKALRGIPVLPHQPDADPVDVTAPLSPRSLLLGQADEEVLLAPPLPGWHPAHTAEQQATLEAIPESFALDLAMGRSAPMDAETSSPLAPARVDRASEPVPMIRSLDHVRRKSSTSPGRLNAAGNLACYPCLTD